MSFPEAPPLRELALAGELPQQERPMGRGGCAAFFAFLRTCATACRTVANSFFNTSLLSCSMATAKIILLSTGSTKKKVKEDTGSRKNQIEKRNIERKAARGKKERGIRKEKVARSLTRKAKKDTRKSDTRKARTRATSGSEPGRRGRTAPRGTSTGKGSPRYAPRGRLRGRPGRAPGAVLCLGATPGGGGT